MVTLTSDCDRITLASTPPDEGWWGSTVRIPNRCYFSSLRRPRCRQDARRTPYVLQALDNFIGEVAQLLVLITGHNVFSMEQSTTIHSKHNAIYRSHCFYLTCPRYTPDTLFLCHVRILLFFPFSLINSQPPGLKTRRRVFKQQSIIDGSYRNWPLQGAPGQQDLPVT